MIDLAPLAGLLEEHRPLLWGIAYRMTGSAADADDLVQESFLRAIERPPQDPVGPRAWLVTVCVNLARDRLRARKRAHYRGPWLPWPAALDEEEAWSVDCPDAEAQALRRESASFAYLLALEALGPVERAVLILREVVGFSTEETARALAIGEANVKVTLSRAKKALAKQERVRVRRARDPEATRQALTRFVAALASDDPAEVVSVLAPDARGLQDSAGEYLAAGIVLEGAEALARAWLGIAKKGGVVTGAEWTRLNGGWALSGTLAGARARARPATRGKSKPPRQVAPRFALLVDVDEAGAITAVYTVLAPRKLSHVPAPIAP